MSSRNVRIINLSSPEEKQWSKLAALAPRMEKLIKSLEWMLDEFSMSCPVCDRAKSYGIHRLDCELGNMIKELDAPIPEET